MKKIVIIISFLLTTALFSLEIIGNFATVLVDEFDKKETIAKIDTGALISALHCTYIKQLDDENVEFIPLYTNQRITKKIQKVTTIKSSNGAKERRFIIKTKITLNNNTYPISFSLTNRETMSYKILLGSEFLKDKFLIDVSK